MGMDQANGQVFLHRQNSREEAEGAVATMTCNQQVHHAALHLRCGFPRLHLSLCPWQVRSLQVSPLGLPQHKWLRKQLGS